MNMSTNIQPAFAGGAVTMIHGKTRRFRFQVQDRITGFGTDVSGWSSFRFLCKTNVADADGSAVIAKTLGSGITAVQAASGLMEILISPADTASLNDVGIHLFAELQGVDPASLPWSLWQGELDIQPTIVQASN